MADKSRIFIGLRIMGQDLDPDSVSRGLQLKPTESHRKGDARSAPVGRSYAPFREGLWSLTSPDSESATIESRIGALLAQLTQKKGVLKKLRARGYRQDVFVGIFLRGENCGFPFPAASLKKFGELGLDLNIDVYP